MSIRIIIINVNSIKILKIVCVFFETVIVFECCVHLNNCSVLTFIGVFKNGKETKKVFHPKEESRQYGTVRMYTDSIIYLIKGSFFDFKRKTVIRLIKKKFDTNYSSDEDVSTGKWSSSVIRKRGRVLTQTL